MKRLLIVTIASLILSYFVFNGCVFGKDQYPKEILRDIDGIIQIIAQADKISDRNEHKYRKITPRMYVLENDESDRFILKNEKEITALIEKLEKSLGNNNIDNDVMFAIAMGLHTLSKADPAYIDKSMAFYERCLSKNINANFEKPTLRVFKKSKSIKLLVDNFDNPMYKDLIGSPKEYFLRLVVNGYAEKGDYTGAKKRIEVARSQRFRGLFLNNLEKYMEKAQEMQREFESTKK